MAEKRAKLLTKDQFDHLVTVVRKSEHPLRDEIALRLSFFAGLRAGEIAKLRWLNNLCDAEGRLLDNIHITGDVGKRAVERVIPLEPTLKALLSQLRRRRPEDEFVFYALHNNNPPMVPVLDAKGNPLIEKASGLPVKMVDPEWAPGQVTPNAVVQWFKRLYAHVNYKGCSSHSGRRTFITVRARDANNRKCSILDVKDLAGHRRLETTAKYIEPSEFRRDLVAAWH